GERRFRATGDDLRQPLPALRRGTGLGDRGAAEQHRRQERARHDRAAHLFHQYDEIDEPEPAAAFLFRVDDAEPALLGQLLPEPVGDCRGFRYSLAHELRCALALEEAPRAVAQHLLLLGEPNVHYSVDRMLPLTLPLRGPL